VIPIIYIPILYNISEHLKKQMNKKKSHKHSNEELFNHIFHKQNGNIFRFQPKI